MVREKSPALCINDVLPHHLLSEVLIRIPSIDVFRCKSVCILWFCIIGVELRRDFIDRFLLHRIRELRSDEEDRELIQVQWNHGEMVVLSPASYCHTASQFNLSYLPVFKDEDAICENLSYLDIVSSNGLLLVPCRRGYYICNPITWEWLIVPPFPPHPAREVVHVGFVSEPFYSINDHDRSVTVNRRFGVKVVRLDFSLYNEDENAREIEVEMFSSSTGSWTTSRVQLPDHVGEKVDREPTNLDNGRMYWVLEEGYEFLIFDINMNEFLRDPADLPSTTALGYPSVNGGIVPFKNRLTKCQGSLWVAQAFAAQLRVHSLVDGEWRVEHDVDMVDDFLCSSSVVKDRKTWNLHDNTDFFAMHPSDPMIGYLAIKKLLLECNFRRRTLTVLIEHEDDDMWLESDNFFVLPVCLPALWPTPLPLIHNNKA